MKDLFTKKSEVEKQNYIDECGFIKVNGELDRIMIAFVGTFELDREKIDNVDDNKIVDAYFMRDNDREFSDMVHALVYDLERKNQFERLRNIFKRIGYLKFLDEKLSLYLDKLSQTTNRPGDLT